MKIFFLKLNFLSLRGFLFCNYIAVNFPIVKGTLSELKNNLVKYVIFLTIAPPLQIKKFKIMNTVKGLNRVIKKFMLESL